MTLCPVAGREGRGLWSAWRCRVMLMERLHIRYVSKKFSKAQDWCVIVWCLAQGWLSVLTSSINCTAAELETQG